VTTRAVYDVNRSLPVVLDDGTRKYVYGLGLAYAVNGISVEVYHTDGLGSVRAITDGTTPAPLVVQTYATDEFGIPDAALTQGSTAQPFQYTGEPRDAESGFVYLRARMYDPQIGRFLQRDPLAGYATIPLSLNRYVCVQNSPVNLADPPAIPAPIRFPQGKPLPKNFPRPVPAPAPTFYPKIAAPQSGPGPGPAPTAKSSVLQQ
jgi:RHS repeat-associated protein